MTSWDVTRSAVYESAVRIEQGDNVVLVSEDDWQEMRDDIDAELGGDDA